MATCKLGRWGWNGLSAASRPMSRMWEHRRFDFPECPIQTRIPERIRNLRGLQTSTASGAVTGGFGFESVMTATSHSSYNALADFVVGKCWTRRSVIASRLHLGQITG